MDFVILIHRVVAEPYIRLIWYKKELSIKKLSTSEMRVYLCFLPDLTGYHCLTTGYHYRSRAQETSMLLVKTSWHCSTSTSSEVNSRGQWTQLACNPPTTEIPDDEDDDDDEHQKVTGTPCITCYNALQGLLKFSNLFVLMP